MAMRASGPLLAAILAVAASAATVAQAADAVEGARLSRQWCADCHVVGAAQGHAMSDAPSFQSIAQRPDFDAKVISYYLLSPHPPMPNLTLSRHEADDLAAYIATQK